MKGREAQVTPKFSKPPVAELALGIQFNPLSSFNSIQAAAWRERIKEEFSKIEEHPELPDIIEGAELEQTKVRMQMIEGVPPRRFWFVNKTETELIQVQRTRFVYNWRKRSDADQYPTYDALRKKVKSQLESFMGFTAAEGLGDVVPGMCEVTYINHITGSGVWTSHAEAAKVFSGLSGKQTGDFLPPAESFSFSETYRIPVDGADKVGRLRVQVDPSFFVLDKSPLFRMSVSARVAAQTADIAGILGAMDVGHVWATCGFAALTTKEMHAAWGNKI